MHLGAVEGSEVTDQDSLPWVVGAVNPSGGNVDARVLEVRPGRNRSESVSAPVRTSPSCIFA